MAESAASWDVSNDFLAVAGSVLVWIGELLIEVPNFAAGTSGLSRVGGTSWNKS